MTNTSTIQLSDMNNGQDGIIDTFTNYGIISSNYNESIKIEKKGYIGNLINYGTITGHIYIGNANEKGAIGTITNYGTMGSIYFSNSAPTQPVNITINNLGIIKAHADGSSGVNDTSNLQASSKNITFTLKNYTIKVNENSMEFNNFSGNKPNTTAIKNSHLVISVNNDGGSVRFKDGDSKIILDFGNDFEFGAKYLINKIVTDESGKSYSALGVDFSRLIPYSDLFSLTQSGDYFIATLNTKASTIGNLYKANIRTMNNFLTISNSMIYPRKSYYSQNLIRKNQNNLVILREQSDRRISKSNIRDSSPKAQNDNIIDSSPKAQNDNIMLDSALSLKSYESFSYRNESINRRIQRQNKRNYSRTKRNNNSVILSDSEESQKKNNRDSSVASLSQNDKMNRSQNLAQNPHDYYFILTPFVNHNYFFESGRYNLSGLEYGFLTAFSGKITPSNSLGTHFMMSYGTFGDSKDKDFNITNLNLNIGLNYKFDMIWDMYLKARGDFFYFLNQVKTLTMFEAIKPNNLGFGVSVAYGKEWDFRQGGVLGVEGGIDYKALQSSTISLQNNATKTISETYQKALYNLIYVDLGLNYNKYFGNFGLNTTLGIKGNITANKLATSKIHISTFNKSVDLMLDNDNFLGYANLGASYVLNAKNFDMEFSLAYYGNFGDRVISNGGGVEWRVLW